MSDQCALNFNGSLKVTKDIQWFYDKDNTQPLTFTTSSTQSGQPLSCNLRNKATNQFLDTVAYKQSDSDEEDLNVFAKPPRHKYATYYIHQKSLMALPLNFIFEKLI